MSSVMGSMQLSLRELIIDMAIFCVEIASRTNARSEFRQRTRALLETLTYKGLHVVLAYCCGKAGEYNVGRMAGYLRDCWRQGKNISAALQQISNIKLERENLSYGLYGSSIIFMLSEALQDSALLDPITAIKRSLQERLLQRLACECAKWLKFFAEAKIEPESR